MENSFTNDPFLEPIDIIMNNITQPNASLTQNQP